MPIQLSHDHVAIRAVDYAGTIAWYQDKLDFTIDQEWPFGDMQLAYLSNGSAKIEILGGSAAEPHATVDTLDDSFGVEEYHHFCVNVADVDVDARRTACPRRRGPRRRHRPRRDRPPPGLFRRQQWQHHRTRRAAALTSEDGHEARSARSRAAHSGSQE